MHPTLIKSASVAVLTSLITSAFALSPDGLCTDDALYKGFFSNTYIAYDVNTFCVQDLGLTQPTVCDHTVTARTTIYPLTTVTGTVTDTVTTYDKTTTVFETGGVVLGLKGKRDAALPDRALITEMPQAVRDVARSAHALQKRATSTDISLILKEVYSACSCGNEAGLVDPGTSYVATCADFTSTIIDPVRLPVATTAFKTVDGGTTTLTVTQNITSNIISVISEMNASKPTWTGSWTGTWNGSSWSDWTNEPTSTTSMSISSPKSAEKTTTGSESTPVSDGETSSTTTSSKSKSVSSGETASSSTSSSKPTTWTNSAWSDSSWSDWTSTFSSETSTTSSKSKSKSITSSSSDGSPAQTTTSSTSTHKATTSSPSVTAPTTLPTECPAANGTVYLSTYDSCSQYLRICGLSYKPKDFYNSAEYFPTPESCTTVCDAENAGQATPCLGIVWNTTAAPGTPNCRQLQSLDNPIKDIYAIALLYIGQSPGCAKSISVPSSSPLTAAPTFPVNFTDSRIIPTGTGSLSFNFTKSRNHTFSHPTGTGGWGSGTGNWGTGSWTGTWNSTHPYPTGTRSRLPHYPTTTDGPANSTTEKPTAPTSSGTGTIGPIATSNNTCPVSTVYAATTKFATMIETVYGSMAMEPVTVYVTNTSTVTVARTRCRTTLTFSTTETITAATDPGSAARWFGAAGRGAWRGA